MRTYYGARRPRRPAPERRVLAGDSLEVASRSSGARGPRHRKYATGWLRVFGRRLKRASRRLHMTSSTDRIEKRILLRAPRARVWRALTDSAEFGAWFRVKLDGPFAVGLTVRGNITYPGYEYLKMEVVVERMDAESLFSFRWHPYAI